MEILINGTFLMVGVLPFSIRNVKFSMSNPFFLSTCFEQSGSNYNVWNVQWSQSVQH